MHFVKLKAVADSEYPAVIRMAAVKLMQHQYMDVGTFLKELNKNDLDELAGYCDAITLRQDAGDMLDSIILLGEMLSQAEGTPLDVPDINRAANLMILITFEDLSRKGLIEFFRQNATLGGDLQEGNIARLK